VDNVSGQGGKAVTILLAPGTARAIDLPPVNAPTGLSSLPRTDSGWTGPSGGSSGGPHRRDHQEHRPADPAPSSPRRDAGCRCATSKRPPPMRTPRTTMQAAGERAGPRRPGLAWYWPVAAYVICAAP